jgi:hypothetical protein
MVKGMPAMTTWILNHIVKEGYLPLWKYMPLAQRFADPAVRFTVLRAGIFPWMGVGKSATPIIVPPTILSMKLILCFWC